MLRGLGPDDPASIGGFRLIGYLGAGGFGTVYLGLDGHGRAVAIKQLRAEYAGHVGYRRRFATEVDAIRRVGGRRVPALVGSDPEAALPWLATWYVAGPSLEETVQRLGPLPLETVTMVGVAIVEALEAIHRAGMLHRDLKPSNVILCPDGPLVIDFGLARILDDPGLTTTPTFLGSSHFMAPEQAADLHNASQPTDVYACAATLVFAATGHSLLHDDLSRDAARRQLRSGHAPQLSGVPAELLLAIKPCLETRPQSRPTPAALRTALVALLPQGQPDIWYAEPISELIAEYQEGLQALIPQRSANPPAPAGQQPPRLPPTRDSAAASRRTDLESRHDALRAPDESYGLVLCRIEPKSAELEFVFVPLFAPRSATAPARLQATEIDIVGPTLGADLVSLPVVRRKPGDEARDWRTVRVGHCPLPPGARMRLRLELDESGDVRFVTPQVAVVDREPWEHLWHSLPERINTPAQFDLLLAVELDGAAADFAARREYIKALLRHLSADPVVAEAGRVGLVGYGDHRIYHDESSADTLARLHRRYLSAAGPTVDEELPRLLISPFGPIQDAARQLDDWESQAARYPNAAPVEEALERLAGFEWRPGARHGLIVVGDRPPHPWPAANGEVIPCPRELGWLDLIGVARRELDLLCVAVGDRARWDEAGPRGDGEVARRAREVWAQLATEGLFDIGYRGFEAVLAGAGLLTQHAADLKRVPLAFLAPDLSAAHGIA